MDQHQNMITFKVKTLNLNTYEIKANTWQTIKSLQHQIQQKTNVPILYQRILYKGVALEVEKTLQDYKIEQDHVVQLIANKLPSQVSISMNESNRRIENSQSNRFSNEHLKTRKHRYLQQRLNGFKMKKMESIELLQQNKHTIDQLMDCLNYNFMQDVIPFKMERRNLLLGEWIDIRDSSGQWSEGQVVNHSAGFVHVHFNGCPDRWNQWISITSDRIMPFRTFTVYSSHHNYLSPFPKFQTQIKTADNINFQSKIDSFMNELSSSLDNLTKIIKDLDFQDKSSEKDESLKNVSNMSINNNEKIVAEQQIQKQEQIHEEEMEKKQECQTPSKEVPVGDNLSNKCEDDISKCDNDDISNKSFRSKKSAGNVETFSMKSEVFDESRKRHNKVFFDKSEEEAKSVRSGKNNYLNKHIYAYNQEYIEEEEDSQYYDQDYEEHQILRKKELKRKMRASQLAPLLDRMGRLFIDLAPHLAMLGHTEQTINTFNENLSTYTNQGSLESKLQVLNQRLLQNNHAFHHQVPPNEEEKPHENHRQSNCQFQIPVMLTPSEIYRLNQMLEEERRLNAQNI